MRIEEVSASHILEEAVTKLRRPHVFDAPKFAGLCADSDEHEKSEMAVAIPEVNLLLN